MLASSMPAVATSVLVLLTCSWGTHATQTPPLRAYQPVARSVLATAETEDEVAQAPLVLAGISVERVRQRNGASRSVAAARGTEARAPKDAGWFGSFSEGESTFDVEADGSTHRDVDSTADRLDGWDLISANPNKKLGLETAAWFDESPSAGGAQAWQTHYPALKDTQLPDGGGRKRGAWRLSDGGHWYQDYLSPPPASPGASRATHDATWFDSAVGQFDGYGRERPPPPQSAAAHQTLASLGVGWEERASNTTLTCAEPGCVATAVLAAPYDLATERAEGCVLSLDLHPTDFDDQYSGERLEWIQVNGVTVSTDCFPMVSGCNASTQTPTFSCLSEFPVDSVLNASTGLLEITSKIPMVVDECPYNGNLLSGVPSVTCLVAPKPPLPAPPPVPVMPTLPAPPPPFLYTSLPLTCPARGCTAETVLSLRPPLGAMLSTCLVDVKVMQTDYDGDQDTIEQIEFVRVDGADVAKNVTPGKNPCRAKWAGKPLSDAELIFAAVEAHEVANVSDRVAVDGSLQVDVAAKITPFVDECAYLGYLLSGVAELNCTLVPTPTAAGALTAATSNSSDGA